MSLIARIKKILWKLTWRRKLCRECSNIFCIGNHGPCYSCREGSNFEYCEMIPEPKREADCNYVYVFKGWGQDDPAPKEAPRDNRPVPKGRPIIMYDKEYDEFGRLERFKIKYADEQEVQK